MNVLYGLIPPGDGKHRHRRYEAGIPRPGDAIPRASAWVHQHFMLIPGVSPCPENVMLANDVDERPFGRLSRPTARAKVRELSQRYR